MLYAYYYHRGWQTIVGKEIEHFIRGVCLWGACLAVTIIIDWHTVMIAALTSVRPFTLRLRRDRLSSSSCS